MEIRGRHTINFCLAPAGEKKHHRTNARMPGRKILTHQINAAQVSKCRTTWSIALLIRAMESTNDLSYQSREQRADRDRQCKNHVRQKRDVIFVCIVSVL